VAYPEAVARMPGSQFFSFMFFLMLITLGLDSQFTMTETLTTAAMDQWPNLRKYKSWVVIGTCAAGFFLGLSMCANGGVYMFTLIDWFSASWSLLLLALMEVILLMYVYGYKNVLKNIEEMSIRLPAPSKYYWLVNWLAITPIILAFITIVTWVKFTPCEYAGYVFPAWVQAIGWLLASTTIVIVISVGLFEYYRRNVIMDKETDWRGMLRPVEKWGPAVGAADAKGKDNEAYDNDGFHYPASEGTGGNYSANSNNL